MWRTALRWHGLLTQRSAVHSYSSSGPLKHARIRLRTLVSGLQTVPGSHHKSITPLCAVPARRMIANNGGINRLRSMPQKPGVLAVWCDTAQVRIIDATSQLQELAAEEQPKNKPTGRIQVAPLAQHSHAMEGFALDWSTAKAGRLASGDCRASIHVWEPQEGGRWGPAGGSCSRRAPPTECPAGPLHCCSRPRCYCSRW